MKEHQGVENLPILADSPQGSIGALAYGYLQGLTQKGIDIFPAPFKHELLHAIYNGGDDGPSEEVIFAYEYVLRVPREFHKNLEKELLQARPGLSCAHFMNAFLRNRQEVLRAEGTEPYAGLSEQEALAHLRCALALAAKLEATHGVEFHAMSEPQAAAIPEEEILPFRYQLHQIMENFAADRSLEATEPATMKTARAAAQQRVESLRAQAGGTATMAKSSSVMAV